METRMKIGKCYPTEWCTSCDARMAGDDVYFKDGVCPHCGERTGAVVAGVNVRVFRSIYHQVKVLGLFWWTTKVEAREIL